MKEIDQLREMYLDIENKSQLKEKEFAAVKKCRLKMKEAIEELEKELEALGTECSSEKSLDMLSKKEREVFLLMVQNLNSHEISKRQNTVLKTVQAQKDSIRKKFKFESVYQLIEFARNYKPEGKKT